MIFNELITSPTRILHDNGAVQTGSMHLPQPLQRDNSINTGSSGSIFRMARVLQAKRASQGSHDWQTVQSTSGLSKFSFPINRFNTLHDVVGLGFSFGFTALSSWECSLSYSARSRNCWRKVSIS